LPASDCISGREHGDKTVGAGCSRDLSATDRHPFRWKAISHRSRATSSQKAFRVQACGLSPGKSIAPRLAPRLHWF
jgi:hypothetical protein